MMEGDVSNDEQGRARYPVDVAAEKALLGVMLWSMPGVYEGHGRRLKGDLWHNEARRMLAEAMIDMHIQGLDVDLVTLTDWLRKAGTLEKVGGPALGDLDSLPLTPGYTEHYVGILEGMAARRMLLRQAEALGQAAVDYSKDWREALQEAEGQLFDAHAKGSHDGMEHVSKILPEVVAGIEETVSRKGHVTNGVATGMTVLDRMTMGLKPGLHFVAARPSMGKTTVLMQIALNVSMGLGDYPEFDQAPLETGVFSLETDKVSLTRRGLLNLAKLNLQRVRDGQMSRAAQEGLLEAAQRMMGSKLYVEACFGLSVQTARAKLRMLVKRLGLKLVLIDYLQLMTSGSKRARDNRNLEIAEISLGLKQAAMELKIPIVVLAQLNREGDVPRPKLSHLRESGQVEQDADTVCMICQAPEWASQNDPEDCPWTYLGLDVVKQKDGPTTTDGEPIVMRFDKEFFRLTSTDEKLFSNKPGERQKTGAVEAPREKWRNDRERGPRGRPRKDGSDGRGGGGGTGESAGEIFGD